MSLPVEQAPLWLEAIKGFSSPLSAVVTGVFSLATAFLGYRLGISKSNHDLRIEQARLKAQDEQATKKALREAREKRLMEWREAISRHTGMYVETRKTSFGYEDFSRTEPYLSLRGHLSERLQRSTEGTLTGPRIVLGELMPEVDTRNQLLARIDELEREWGLA
jgi:hypothetical protein